MIDVRELPPLFQRRWEREANRSSSVKDTLAVIAFLRILRWAWLRAKDYESFAKLISHRRLDTAELAATSDMRITVWDQHLCDMQQHGASSFIKNELYASWFSDYCTDKQGVPPVFWYSAWPDGTLDQGIVSRYAKQNYDMAIECTARYQPEMTISILLPMQWYPLLARYLPKFKLTGFVVETSADSTQISCRITQEFVSSMRNESLSENLSALLGCITYSAMRRTLKEHADEEAEKQIRWINQKKEGTYLILDIKREWYLRLIRETTDIAVRNYGQTMLHKLEDERTQHIIGSAELKDKIKAPMLADIDRRYPETPQYLAQLTLLQARYTQLYY